MALWLPYWPPDSGDVKTYFTLAWAGIQAFLGSICLSMEPFSDPLIHPVSEFRHSLVYMLSGSFIDSFIAASTVP